MTIQMHDCTMSDIETYFNFDVIAGFWFDCQGFQNLTI